jgi:hypothetical protein
MLKFNGWSRDGDSKLQRSLMNGFCASFFILEVDTAPEAAGWQLRKSITAGENDG